VIQKGTSSWPWKKENLGERAALRNEIQQGGKRASGRRRTERQPEKETTVSLHIVKKQEKAILSLFGGGRMQVRKKGGRKRAWNKRRGLPPRMRGGSAYKQTVKSKMEEVISTTPREGGADPLYEFLRRRGGLRKEHSWENPRENF